MKTLFGTRLKVTVAILLLGAASGFAQSGVHRFGAITSQPDRTISLGLLGEAPPAFLNYFDLYHKCLEIEVARDRVLPLEPNFR